MVICFFPKLFARWWQLKYFHPENWENSHFDEYLLKGWEKTTNSFDICLLAILGENVSRKVTFKKFFALIEAIFQISNESKLNPRNLGWGNPRGRGTGGGGGEWWKG